jgi:hypothetical protein
LGQERHFAGIRQNGIVKFDGMAGWERIIDLSSAKTGLSASVNGRRKAVIHAVDDSTCYFIS